MLVHLRVSIPWMEEILHQLVDDLSHYNPNFFFTVFHDVSWLPLVTNWCRISSIHSSFLEKTHHFYLQAPANISNETQVAQAPQAPQAAWVAWGVASSLHVLMTSKVFKVAKHNE